MGLTGASAGSCYGFAVRSELPFIYLRAGAGERLDIDVRTLDDPDPSYQLVKEWTDPFEARIFGDGARYRLWINGSGWFEIDPAVPRISIPEGADPIRREEQLWGVPALLCFLARGRLPLHAAAIEVDGGAVLLGAHRTLGKSTLAAGFVRAGHRLLNEDLCCIDLSSRPAVIPGPAMLRLRPDIGKELDLPGTTDVKETDDRRHLALDPRTRGDCGPVPIRGVVFLVRSDDGIRAERVPPFVAVRDLFPLSFRLPGDESIRSCFTGVSDVAREVPVWAMHYPRRLEELPRVVEAIAGLE